MKSNMTEALTMLNKLIDQGVEYPEAKFNVSIALDMGDRQIERLQVLYDNQSD